MRRQDAIRRVVARFEERAFQETGDVEAASAFLCGLLGCLRALHWLHWTLHWKVRGTSSYGDHLLFERMYTGMVDEIDTLAEKIAGFHGSDMIGPHGHFDVAGVFLSQWTSSGSAYDQALLAERRLQDVVRQTYEDVKATGSMTLGLDDYLMALASAHETNIYLLQQRAGSTRQATDAYLSHDQRRQAWEQLKSKLTLLPVALPMARRGIEAWKSADGLIYVVNLVAGQAGVAQNKWEAESFARWMSQGRWIQEPQWDLRRPIKASVSPADMSAEAHFFDKPRAREVREFAQSGAVSNDYGVAAHASRAGDASVRAEVDKAPPTTAEILELPGGPEFSTLNRYVVETLVDTHKDVPQGHDEVAKHPRIVPR